jgi:hypothetical protein
MFFASSHPVAQESKLFIDFSLPFQLTSQIFLISAIFQKQSDQRDVLKLRFVIWSVRSQIIRKGFASLKDGPKVDDL